MVRGAGNPASFSLRTSHVLGRPSRPPSAFLRSASLRPVDPVEEVFLFGELRSGNFLSLSNSVKWGKPSPGSSRFGSGPLRLPPPLLAGAPRNAP